MKVRLERNWAKGVLCVAVLLMAALNAGGTAYAQTQPIQWELDTDTRASALSGGASKVKLYGVALQMGADLAPEVHIRVYGSYQYDAYGLQQATIEKEWGGNAGRAQVGLVRLPFGIYDPQETYDSGLIDNPMARDGYQSHSVDWAAPGVFWSGGPPQLQIEAAAVYGQGTDIWNHQSQVRGVVGRAQTYVGNAIVGISHWEGSLPNDSDRSMRSPVHMTGLDLRYTYPQLILRGEYLFGTLTGDQTRGWYLDAYYRLPRNEQWSLIARIEQFKPEADEAQARQVTLGVRYVATREWTLSANWRRNNDRSYDTFAPATTGSGEVLFQAYHRANW